ncbi:MAG: Gfo/Idh/MocA family oxidoreductase, partial [Candidatus Bathyarchaeota archaeon]
MQKIRIGLIGCGNIVQYYLPQLLKLDTAEVVAACDINAQSLKRVGTQAGLSQSQLFGNSQQLLQQDSIDAVLVCIPNRYHAPVTIAAFEAGKHVFCEKPMALNFSEAQMMLQAAEKNDRKLLIGLNSRFEGNSPILKRHVDAGELGEIYYAKCSFLRRSGIPGWGSWFTKKDVAGSGAIFDIGVHILDLAFWLMANFRPATAYASSYAKFGPEKKGLGDWAQPEFEGYFDVEELASAFLKMENGATVFFEASWASHIAQDIFNVTLLGDAAGLDLESSSLFTTELNGLSDKKLQYAQEDPYFAELNHFTNCILNDEKTITRPDEMLGLQKALDMILLSCRE